MKHSDKIKKKSKNFKVTQKLQVELYEGSFVSLIFVSTAVLPLHRLTLFRGFLWGFQTSTSSSSGPFVPMLRTSLFFFFQASRSSHELRRLTQGKAKLSEDAEISISTRAIGMVAASMVPNFLRED